MDHLSDNSTGLNSEETKALLAEARQIVEERDQLRERAEEALYGYQSFIIHYAAIFFDIGTPLTALTTDPATEEQFSSVALYMAQNNKGIFQVGDDIFAAMREQIRHHTNMRNLFFSMLCSSIITSWAAYMLHNSAYSIPGIAVLALSFIIDAIMFYVLIFKYDPKRLKEYSRRYDAFIGFHELAKRAEAEANSNK